MTKFYPSTLTHVLILTLLQFIVPLCIFYLTPSIYWHTFPRFRKLYLRATFSAACTPPLSCTANVSEYPTPICKLSWSTWHTTNLQSTASVTMNLILLIFLASYASSQNKTACSYYCLLLCTTVGTCSQVKTTFGCCVRLCSIHRLTAAWCRVSPKEYKQSFCHLMCVKKPCNVHLVGLCFPMKVPPPQCRVRYDLWTGRTGAGRGHSLGYMNFTLTTVCGWEEQWRRLCSGWFCVSWWLRHYLCRPRTRRSNTQTAWLYWWRGDR